MCVALFWQESEESRAGAFWGGSDTAGLNLRLQPSCVIRHTPGKWRAEGRDAAREDRSARSGTRRNEQSAQTSPSAERPASGAGLAPLSQSGSSPIWMKALRGTLDRSLA
jgi:hypothetical protein